MILILQVHIGLVVHLFTCQEMLLNLLKACVVQGSIIVELILVLLIEDIILSLSVQEQLIPLDLLIMLTIHLRLIMPRPTIPGTFIMANLHK
jgi:hypothetical protein